MNLNPFKTKKADLRFSLFTRVILYTLVALLIAGLSFFFMRFEEKKLNISDTLKVITYTDTEEIGGSSRCEYEIKNEMLTYQYQLGKGASYSYAGINLLIDPFIPLDGRDLIHFKLQTEKKAKIHLSLLLANNHNDSIWIEVPFFAEKGENQCTVNISDCIVPNWWIIQVNPPDELSQNWPNNIKKVGFTHNILSPIGIKDFVNIGDITFAYSNNLAKRILYIGLLFEILFIVLYEFLISQKKQVVINYKSLDHAVIEPIDLSNINLKEVVDFISNNYQDSELSLKTIRNKVKITENVISKLIRENFNLGFNDYINQIRLEEAKRLLNTTKLNINEIADLTGFGSVSSFNRIFKNKMGESPSYYRKGQNANE